MGHLGHSTTVANRPKSRCLQQFREHTSEEAPQSAAQARSHISTYGMAERAYESVFGERGMEPLPEVLGDVQPAHAANVEEIHCILHIKQSNKNRRSATTS